MGSPAPPYRQRQARAHDASRRSVLAGAIVAAALWTSGAARSEAQVTIEPEEAWANIYGDAPFTRHLTVKSERVLEGRLVWSFALGGRTITRGERGVRAGPGTAATVTLALAAPPVKDGAILSARLTVAVSENPEGAPLARLEQAIAIFPRDPFAGRTEWLKGLKVVLYDPARATADVLEKAAVPFEPLREPASLDAVTEGVIVIGEGVAWDEQRGLAEAVVQAAARGRPVLCLAPASGRLALPGMGDPPLAAPRRLSWRRNDVIADLEKRLDASAWPPDGKVVACSFVTRAEGNELITAVSPASAGWSWLEAEFAEGRGRLIVCGFGIVAHWDAGPAPRFLLERILAHLSEDPGPRPRLEERTER